MKKILVLLIIMSIFAFSCTLVERNKNKTNDALEKNDLSADSIASDIFERSDSISKDSVYLVQ